MADLSVKYLGLSLKNPIIAGSSRLTSTLDKIKECEDNQAGAVVLKSLFEEQILADTNKIMDGINTSAHADVYDFYNNISQNKFIDEYLDLIEKSKKSISIPVIASLNCVTAGNWIQYASELEKSGADALEINAFILPSDVEKEGKEIEKVYFELVRKIKRKTRLPISLKLGTHFSGLANFLKRLFIEGVDGFVLFNRFFRPDININTMKIVPAKVTSSEEENAQTLHWLTLLAEEIDAYFSASTGIHDGKGVIKQLLAGADSVQMCSALIKNGLGTISQSLNELTSWMDKNGFASISDFKGKLSQEKSDNPELYERTQYIKALTGLI